MIYPTTHGSEALKSNLPKFANRAEALAAARELTSRICARGARTEADRMVPTDTIDELIASGLTGIVTPRIFGGSELGMSSLVEVTAEISSACGSTGWVFGVLTGHSWMLNLFPVEVQKEVNGVPGALSATVYRLAGTVTRVEGGYRLVSGEGRFCSGIDHVQWVIVGSAVLSENEPPEPRFFVVPRSEVEIVDDWYTAGMRGTGSRSIKISEAFIPEHRSVSVAELQNGETEGGRFHSGPLYRMPMMGLPPFSIIGAPLGMARGAIRSLSENLKKRMASLGELQLAEQSVMFARIAQASVDVDTAYALVMEDAAVIDNADDAGSIATLQRVRFQRDVAFAAQKCRNAITNLFEVSGGSGIYETSDLQRIWRDVNAAASHFAFNWDSAAVSYGRALLGLSPNSIDYKKRQN
ncbi:acyl-CoA dehydrogenase family protein [Caballeronia sordidicola]|jgi:alkylation response protein AidB-like acyl-CoA dehydrogenase|uniref:Pigment protein n=1 Tax=Caballeronia sordidicola TaxID=196367 RepID=A0A226X159_CABSO|nr:acyl-CoA dehydrogenase family protein [Caballeronia sordidicola]OXC76730.1 Pigment protein [Caballeronia sordidicola]